jgi:CRP-like cAMP-binding protein
VKHRKLLTFQLPYNYSSSSVVSAIEQALTASAIEGIAENPQPRCVILDFHPQYVQYGALVWLMRPGMEFADSSRVRTRITFALTRMGAPLTSISHVLDMRSSVDPQESVDAETADRLAALRGVEILQCLNEEEARRLAPLMKRTSFAAGEVILRQGDSGDSLYILKRGRVRILLANNSGLSEQVACLNPGDFFGEMSLLTGELRSATALALDDVDCYCLAKADMQALFANRPELADEISMVLTTRGAGLATLRDRLDDAAEKQRIMQNRGDLLSRIRRYFAAP